MKVSLIALFLGLAMLAQSKETAARLPAGVPAGAAAVDGDTWRWVDKQGKAWLYRATPFGVMRSEEPKQTAAKRPAGVPADATPVAEGIWRWVDGSRKTWIFQETPAGLMKSEEPKGETATVGPTGHKVADARQDAVLDLMSVQEEGDSLRFSRPGPFGKYSWVKKKTQLDRDETIVWDRARAKSASATAKKD
ncbi:MAG TPA: hypothetical protein VFQ91_05940 [Bryobacteraceae bacterium]|nr:hypothetical protein [Bryobacteraceae bacterium]